jgi:hypothetical protein
MADLIVEEQVFTYFTWRGRMRFILRIASRGLVHLAGFAYAKELENYRLRILNLANIFKDILVSLPAVNSLPSLMIILI